MSQKSQYLAECWYAKNRTPEQQRALDEAGRRAYARACRQTEVILFSLSLGIVLSWVLSALIS